MIDKNSIDQFNNIFPKEISEEFLFTLYDYCLFLEDLSINPLSFYRKWNDSYRKSVIDKYWNK